MLKSFFSRHITLFICLFTPFLPKTPGTHIPPCPCLDDVKEDALPRPLTPRNVSSLTSGLYTTSDLVTFRSLLLISSVSLVSSLGSLTDPGLTFTGLTSLESVTPRVVYGQGTSLLNVKVVHQNIDTTRTLTLTLPLTHLLRVNLYKPKT